MTQDKMRRIITACVSAATVLLVFLFGYLIYQWVSLGVQRKKIDTLNAEITEIRLQIEEYEGQEEYYESYFGLQMQLNELEMKKALIEGK